ncbi:hypothetical protein L905_19155 [Agrobacterium sp. TS43]|uniref:hypothetical protein n=1 Tax=Agrobacterium TaxID=357 RepID=UPI000745A32D|nr:MULTISPECIES: hypothetical protein [Agrobacterium]KVK62688.1 hypothetical protein L906_18630 [Agrobacterium sp. TS45]KVK65073.1 hypothetical protein L905_19155 [Agrobacterium sp. TS43]
MVALQTDAGKVFSACRTTLIEISAFLQAHKSTALIEVGAILDRLVDQLGDGGALEETLDFVLFELDSIYESDYYDPLDATEIHGMSVATRLTDVVRGLRILSDHLEFERQLTSSGTASKASLRLTSVQPAPVQEAVNQIHRRIRLGEKEFRELVLDQPRIPQIEGLGYLAERVSDLVDQLRLAGEATLNMAVENLTHALDDLMYEHSDLLASESATRLRQTFEAASEVAHDLLSEISGTVGVDDPIVTHREQALAPFQFAISGDRLTVQSQATHPKTGSERIVAAAARALNAQAEDLADDLEGSNHPRLFRAFNRLRTALSDGSSVVEIGMLCSTLDGQIRAASEELSESLLALLLSFSKGVMDFASQFEEWQEFSDNAAEASFEPQDGENYTKIARVLAAELERRQEVDSKVPEALRQVAEWNAKTDSPRSRLSLGRTVLNIITVCFNELVKKPAQIAIGVTGTAIVAVVLHQAAIHAAEISRTPEGSWLRPAVRVIENHIGKLENP